MEASEARRLRAIEDGNRRLKQLAADLSLRNQFWKQRFKNGELCHFADCVVVAKWIIQVSVPSA